MEIKPNSLQIAMMMAEQKQGGKKSLPEKPRNTK